eukprot:scaffold4847_cov89-Cylindrotheca_fusiformis.AAC.5
MLNLSNAPILAAKDRTNGCWKVAQPCSNSSRILSPLRDSEMEVLQRLLLGWAPAVAGAKGVRCDGPEAIKAPNGFWRNNSAGRWIPVAGCKCDASEFPLKNQSSEFVSSSASS